MPVIYCVNCDTLLEDADNESGMPAVVLDYDDQCPKTRGYHVMPDGRPWYRRKFDF